jgi:hypothetical protein
LIFVVVATEPYVMGFVLLAAYVASGIASTYLYYRRKPVPDKTEEETPSPKPVQPLIPPEPRPRHAPSPHPREKVLYALITVLVVLVAVELGLHVIDFVARRLQPSPGPLPFRGLYQDQEWAAALARESDKPHRDQQYHPYLTWISKPVQGRFVNIDRDAGRRTWNPPDLPPDAATVYVFGGSACWGWGARDDYTIPSQLSRLLNAQAPRFRVYNYGEPAYTFTQGLLYLILKLRQGSRPDYVIFYDGFNDVYGAYQSGQAGALQNLATMQESWKPNPGNFSGWP